VQIITHTEHNVMHRIYASVMQASSKTLKQVMLNITLKYAAEKIQPNSLHITDQI